MIRLITKRPRFKSIISFGHSIPGPRRNLIYLSSVLSLDGTLLHFVRAGRATSVFFFLSLFLLALASIIAQSAQIKISPDFLCLTENLAPPHFLQSFIHQSEYIRPYLDPCQLEALECMGLPCSQPQQISRLHFFQPIRIERPCWHQPDRFSPRRFL